MSPLQAAPLARGSVTLRLFAVLLLIVVAVTVSIALLASNVLQNARQQQQRETEEHFSTRLHLMDEGWAHVAYATRQQFELWQSAGRELPQAELDARLKTLLVNLADQGDFSQAVVVDRAGRVLVGHGTRSLASTLIEKTSAPDGAGWFFSVADQTVYRTVAGPMRHGGQAARLVLYFPIDNALLRRLSFPGTRLDLSHVGSIVARSEPGASPASSPSSAGVVTQASRLSWDQLPGSPSLLIERRLVSPLSDRLLLWVALAGAGSIVFIGWLVLGRWVRSQSQRLHQLQVVASEFATTPGMTPALVQRLSSAAGEQDDISALAAKLQAMMERIEAAREEQRQASESLADANLRLEDRVAERTHALEQARDEALAASRAKEQFLSNLSHEIRTPMNGMLGAMELLSRTELSAKQADYIQVAGVSGEALLGIINDVLDFAKLGTGRAHLAHELIDPNAVARSVTTLFAAAAQGKGLSLRLEADPRPVGWRLGDGMRLRQVLLNLVGNAMKFTQRGEIVLRITQKSTPDALDSIGFEVSDTGPGIDPADHERIFEPFVQAQDRGGERHGGTGLGLAISRQLVRAMGGELSLSSTLGQGASFRFTLDLPHAPGEVPSAADQPPQVATPERQPVHGHVLLVEDNGVNRLIASAMLTEMGLEVLCAENGEEALKVLADTPVDLVLMDCQMPVLDGYEATHRLREIERSGHLRRTPVVALTANALSGDVQRCFGAGMDAHLGKPFTLNQLHTTLAPWLSVRGDAARLP